MEKNGRKLIHTRDIVDWRWHLLFVQQPDENGKMFILDDTDYWLLLLWLLLSVEWKFISHCYGFSNVPSIFHFIDAILDSTINPYAYHSRYQWADIQDWCVIFFMLSNWRRPYMNWLNSFRDPLFYYSTFHLCLFIVCVCILIMFNHHFMNSFYNIINIDSPRTSYIAILYAETHFISQ